MSFAILILITVASITHKMLLLEIPVKLPLFSVEISLLGFFAVVPVLFVIFHFYTLLQLNALALKVRGYNEERKENESVVKGNKRRLRLDSFALVQILAEPNEKSNIITYYLYTWVTWITIVLLPLFTLVTTEIVFLPYHSRIITWIIRILICVDVLTIWLFWRMIFSKCHGDSLYKKTRHVYRVVAVLLSASLCIFAIFVVSFPGEHKLGKFKSFNYITHLLFEGGLYKNGGSYTGLFGMSNRLVLAGADLGIADTLKAQKETGALTSTTRSFQNRDLSYAVLEGTDLRGVDFTSTNLSGAIFSDAHLEGAVFDCPKHARADICNNLSNAWLRKANLRGAVFSRTNLSGTYFGFASMSGAIFNKVKLDGTIFQGANLDGSVFNGINSAKTDFSDASLRGSYLRGVSIEQLNIANVNFDGAVFFDTTLKDILFEESKTPDPLSAWSDVSELDFRYVFQSSKKHSTHRVRFLGSVIDKIDLNCKNDNECRNMLDIEAAYNLIITKREQATNNEMSSSTHDKDPKFMSALEEKSNILRSKSTEERVNSRFFILQDLTCQNINRKYIVPNLIRSKAFYSLAMDQYPAIEECIKREAPSMEIAEQFAYEPYEPSREHSAGD